MAKVSAEIEILCTYFGGLQLHFREFFLDYLGIDTSFVGNDTENPEISYSMELYFQTFYRKRHCVKSVVFTVFLVHIFCLIRTEYGEMERFLGH